MGYAECLYTLGIMLTASLVVAVVFFAVIYAAVALGFIEVVDDE